MAFARKVSSDLIRALRYNAKEGTIVIVRRVKKDDGGWDNTPPEDITDTFRAIFDLKNVGSCWVTFTKEDGPLVENLVPMGQSIGRRPRAAGPSAKFREGFRILCKLDEKFEDGPFVREILSSAQVLRDGLSDAHTDYQAGVRTHSGQLPILILVDKKEVEVFEGTAFRPVLKIDGWADRPDGLPDMPPQRDDTGQGGGGGGGERRGENNEAAEAAASRGYADKSGGGSSGGGFGSGGARRSGDNQDMDDEIPFGCPSLEGNRDNKPPL